MRQGLQLSGCQPRRRPLQTGINAKILKVSPEWRQIMIDEFFFCIFAKFETHPSNSFRGNRCWSHKHSFLNMIGAKLSEQRIACRFKPINQCSCLPAAARRGLNPKAGCRGKPSADWYFWAYTLCEIKTLYFSKWYRHRGSQALIWNQDLNLFWTEIDNSEPKRCVKLTFSSNF